MADSITLQLIGERSLEAKIRATDNVLEGPALSRALMKGARIVRDELIRRAPQGPTGNLKRSPVAKGFRPSRGQAAVAFAAIDRVIAPHAHLVTEGSAERFHASGKSVGVMPENFFFESSVKVTRAKVANVIREATTRAVKREWEKT